MKHVSLSKIKPSGLTKVAGLFVLAILAVGFFVFPFAAFAGCGGGQNNAQVSVNGVLDGTQLIGVAKKIPAAANKNATVGTTNPTNPTANTPPPSGSTILGLLNQLKFKPFTGTVSNGSVFVGTAKVKGDNQAVPVLGIIVNNKPIVITKNGTSTSNKVALVGEGKANDPTPGD